jgi:hypothetical protein
MVLDPTTGLYNDEARWYSTAVSTFISRDPAQADENLYRYCGNNPVILVDPSGLKWHVDRDRQPRATVWNDSWLDTVKDLADLIHLTASEYKKWLKAEGTNRNEMPCDENRALGRCRVFSVPNTAYIDVSTYTWGLLGATLKSWDSEYQALFKKHKLNVVHTGPGATGRAILDHLSSDDICSFVYIGHGAEPQGGVTYVGGMDELAPGGENGSDLIPPARYTKYAIVTMDIIACYSNSGAAGWARNVSSNGGTLGTIVGKGIQLSLKLVSQAGTG